MRQVLVVHTVKHCNCSTTTVSLLPYILYARSWGGKVSMISPGAIRLDLYFASILITTSRAVSDAITTSIRKSSIWSLEIDLKCSDLEIRRHTTAATAKPYQIHDSAPKASPMV